MQTKRKRYSAKFKSRVALEALKEQKTLSELSSAYGIHSNQVSLWKKQLLTEAENIFSNKRHRQEKEQDILPVIQHTGMAIFLSAATTMVGVGSLALGQHRGAASLGILLILGVGSCLVSATLFLPALLQLLKKKSSGNT